MYSLYLAVFLKGTSPSELEFLIKSGAQCIIFAHIMYMYVCIVQVRRGR